MGQFTDLQIQAAPHRHKEYFLADGDGLHLRVRPTRKVWVYRYKADGWEVKLGLGRYPAISLAVARQKARMEMEKRANGIDPKQDRRTLREQARVRRLQTFRQMRVPGMRRRKRIVSGRRPSRWPVHWSSKH